MGKALKITQRRSRLKFEITVLNHMIIFGKLFVIERRKAGLIALSSLFSTLANEAAPPPNPSVDSTLAAPVSALTTLAVWGEGLILKFSVSFVHRKTEKTKLLPMGLGLGLEGPQGDDGKYHKNGVLFRA